MLHTNRVVHVHVICLCTIYKRSCYVAQWISLRVMREVHTAVFLMFLVVFRYCTPHYHVGQSMQWNLTQSWVRSRLYKTCNVLNTLLIQYSNVGSDVLQNNGSSVALREWRHRRPCYVRENDVREV